MRVFAKAFVCQEGEDRSKVSSRLASLNPGSLVQVAKQDASRNEAFFEMLAAQTVQASASGCLLAKKPEIDFLLRLAGTTQISAALRKCGAKDGEAFMVMAAGRRRVRAERDLSKLELPRRALSEEELERVESAALLNARRP